MSVADIQGRMVVDAGCHATELVRPAIIAPSQRKLMKELESHLPPDCDEEDVFRFNRLRMFSEANTPEDMQPMGPDGGRDVSITNPEDLTQ